MSKPLSFQENNQILFESCLEHVDDFEDGPVWFGKLPAEAQKKTWWTKSEKAVFVELLARKGVSQLDKIVKVINKSPAEGEMYLNLLQSAVQNEPSLPPLTYLDIPAAIETDNEEDLNENETEEFSKVDPEHGSLLNYLALMKKFNCVLTAEAAQSIEEAVIERIKGILYYCKFCQSGPADVEYMLDQYYQVYPDPVLEKCQDTEALSRDDSEGEDYEAAIDTDLEDQETELLEAVDKGRDASNLHSSADLRAYMDLNQTN